MKKYIPLFEDFDLPDDYAGLPDDEPTHRILTPLEKNISMLQKIFDDIEEVDLPGEDFTEELAQAFNKVMVIDPEGHSMFNKHINTIEHEDDIIDVAFAIMNDWMYDTKTGDWFHTQLANMNIEEDTISVITNKIQSMVTFNYND